MRTAGKEEIEQSIDVKAMVAAVAQAYRDHSAGRMTSVPVSYMCFEEPPGEVHIKGAHIHDAPHFTVKIASNFDGNRSAGMQPNDGLMILFDRKTGHPLLLLEDHGWLTDLRTAIAGAITAQIIAPAHPKKLGIVGTGIQAAMQSRWTARMIGVNEILIWGRNAKSSRALAASLAADGFNAIATDDVAKLCAEADLVVTTTAARSPILTSAMVRPGLRIVAVGSDAPGKREIDPELVAAADLILVDDREQCTAYGECACGTVRADRLIEIGDVLGAKAKLHLPSDAVVIADLTGLGVQDAAIAAAVDSALRKKALA